LNAVPTRSKIMRTCANLLAIGGLVLTLVFPSVPLAGVACLLVLNASAANGTEN
jgi:hypothetical protein